MNWSQEKKEWFGNSRGDILAGIVSSLLSFLKWLAFALWLVSVR